MSVRKIVKIDEGKCTGCGLCVPNCHEGALQIIDGKARLMSDLFCDGLGACLGHCPEGAIAIEEREAEPYDETKVMAENIAPAGENTIRAHLLHLKDHGAHKLFQEGVQYLNDNGIPIPEGVVSPHSHGQEDRLPCGCPGSQVQDFKDTSVHEETTCNPGSRPSRLRQWPVQLMLVPPHAPYLDDSDLLIAADCVPFAYADFHEDFVKGRVVLVGCPKLDDAEHYGRKLTQIFQQNSIRSVTCTHMEVPCCFGLPNLIKNAIAASGKDIPFRDVTITVRGEVRD